MTVKLQASIEWYVNKMGACPADISDVIPAEDGWMIVGIPGDMKYRGRYQSQAYQLGVRQMQMTASGLIQRLR